MKIPGHNEVTQEVIKVLERYAPDDNYTFLELGNWLTDVSQAGSPVDSAAALFAARRTIILALRDLPVPFVAGTLMAMDLPNRLARFLIGESPLIENFRDSRFGAYLRDLSYIYGWMEFCYRPAHGRGGIGPGLPFEDYDRAFTDRFTQYFPHEHLDRVPRNRDEPSEEGRRVFGYLENDLEYVAELLTTIERDWGEHHRRMAQLRHRLRVVPEDDSAARDRLETQRSERERERQDLLLSFGHALHAVEDFFAHSNFVDIAMRELGRSPAFVPGAAADAPDLRRRFERRLRSEIDPPDRGDDNNGNPLMPGPMQAEERIVTGYFDGLDTGFSLSSMVEGREHMLEQIRGEAGSLVSDDMARCMDWSETRPECQPYYDQFYEQVEMPQPVREAHARMIRTDQELREQGRGPDLTMPRILEGVLQGGMDARERQFADGSLWLERPGSHTLLAKDGEDGNPGYREGLSLAKRVSTYIGDLMIRRSRVASVPVTTSADGVLQVNLHGRNHVDWLELLRYFCNHPNDVEPFEYGLLEPPEPASVQVAELSLGFPRNGGDPTPSAQAELDDWLAELSDAHPDAKVWIEGHSSTDGQAFDEFDDEEFARRRALNDALSRQRAEQIAAIVAGVLGRAQVERVEWFGETLPIADNATDAGRSTNRRVVVRAYAPAPPDQYRWWHHAIDDFEAAHGHIVRFVSADEAEQRTQFEMRDFLEQEYNSQASIDEANYELWRSAFDGTHTHEELELRPGQRYTVTHDDVDTGAIRVVCRAGRVRIQTATRVRRQWMPDVDESLGDNGVWTGEFTEQHWRMDQDNRLTITAGSSGATCDVDVVSYDRKRPTRPAR